ncbi:Plug domain-containing protein, partial [Methylobacterium sp. Leaf88]|uniref:TonB-dependent receptor plug domain-containing protein n=1 Tax=Methylobacterium sp. Leaf88 TaxID=1736244 RepID=UPI001FCE07F6
MFPYPSVRRPVRALAILLGASPLAIAMAQAQTAGQAVTLEELSVEGQGGGAGQGRGRTALSPAAAAAPTPIDRPVGEVVTSLGRDGIIENRPATSIGSVLANSPGVTVRQGNGGRDVVISIRGNNARSTGVIKNTVVLEDGFILTQPDGASRFDLVDPRAYGRVDVFRGPQSAL